MEKIKVICKNCKKEYSLDSYIVPSKTKCKYCNKKGLKEIESESNNN